MELVIGSDMPSRSQIASYYLSIKPPSWLWQLLESLRRECCVDASYSVDKLHSTLLPLGHDVRVIGAIQAALADFQAPSFHMIFDRLEGVTLKPSERIRGLEAFHPALLAHLMRKGVRLPRYKLRPHLNLRYGEQRAGTFDIDPISWLNDELLLIESAFGRHKTRARWALTRPNPARYRDTDRDRLPSRAAPSHAGTGAP